MEKFILLGASRGLGWETYLQLSEKLPQGRFLLSSRKILEKRAHVNERTLLVPQDFSKSPLNPGFIEELKKFEGGYLIYFAGGGPYGIFQDKKWSDHMWSLQTSFLSAAELIHAIFSKKAEWASLKKVVLIGSSVAESSPDPLASSYSAAKHALKGLVTSINTEQKASPELLLFSPGYMQTDLLPLSSAPRANKLAENPRVVAERLIDFIQIK